MNDVLERPLLAISHYGTDEEPKLPRNAAKRIKHRPLGRAFGRDDIELFEPNGELGFGMEFINRLHDMSVLNTFSLDFALLALGWPGPSLWRQPLVLFPGTVFESRAGFPYIRTAYYARGSNRFYDGMQLVADLTGHELVARLKTVG